MRFVEKYLDDGAGTLAVILILSKMGVYLNSKPNVCQWIDSVPENAGFICYPPLFAGDYEKMFRVIDEMFDWSSPEFESINKERMNAIFEKLIQRKYFMFGTNDYLDDFKQYLVGMSQTTNHGVLIYIYATSDKSMVVLPRQATAPLLIPRLADKEGIGETMRLIELKQEQFQALRSQYMNVHINPEQATIALGVTVDNKLIVVYSFSAASTMVEVSKYVDAPNIYLLSDFPIAPVKYERIARLVLCATLSKESKEIAEKICGKRIFTLTTTAFTKKPVSMKYRGLFRLLNKKQLEWTSADETDMSKFITETVICSVMERSLDNGR